MKEKKIGWNVVWFIKLDKSGVFWTYSSGSGKQQKCHIYQDISLQSDRGITSPSQTLSTVEHSSSFINWAPSTWNFKTDSQTRNSGCGRFGGDFRQSEFRLCTGNFGKGRCGVGFGSMGPAPRKWYKHVVFRGNEWSGEVKTPPTFPFSQNSQRLLRAYFGESMSTNLICVN